MQHKWKVLIVALFINLSLWANDIIPVSRAGEISSALDISPGFYAFLVSLPVLMMVVFSIPAGFIVVKMGAKRTATLGLGISLAGAILRAFSPDSLTYAIFTAVYGIGMAVTFTNLPKIAESEFSRNEQGIASGVYMSGLPLGAIIALIAGSSTELSWQIALILYSLLFIVAIPLWLLLARDVSPAKLSKDDFVSVARNPGLWILSVANLTLLITYFGVTTYLPMQKNMQAIIGSLTPLLISSVSFALIFGLLVLPRLTTKMNERKIAVSYQIGTAISLVLFLLSLLSSSNLVWFFSVLAGVLLGGTIPLFFAFLTRIGIKSEMFGVASGIFVSVLNIGGFSAPILAHYCDASFGLTGVIFLFSVASLLGAILTAFIPMDSEGGIEAKD